MDIIETCLIMKSWKSIVWPHHDLILSLLENIRLDIWDPKYGQLYQEM